MSAQPTQRPATIALVHLRHTCGAQPGAALCGYTPGTNPGADKYFTPIPDHQLHRYQDCAVCEDLWETARESNLHCGRCKRKIRE